MANEPLSFQGWMGLDKDSAQGNMVWQSFEPKKWEETDVDIKISHCGICGSDLHTLRSGWRPTRYPCCVGHEIIGTVVRVGSQTTGLQLGDRVGLGAQSDSCRGRFGDCAECVAGREQYCTKRFVGTYAGTHFNGDESQGGYGLYNRSPAHFVVKIPPGLDSEHAAPMLCAGLTTYSPLKRYGAGPGKSVGIIGVGGLGHFAILWAKALGADRVVAFSRTDDKRQDALRLGADELVATQADGWASQHQQTLDLIISTVSSSKCGNPEDGLFQVPAPALISRRIKLTGSLVGSPAEIQEMLALAVEKKVVPMVEVRSMKEANKAIVDMELGKARYRYVLVNE
ncbi:hypothetical protein E8E14_008749 [Neopestalotiopsis sp. 37M]|nr:hypothetical protein E8E14_008749 [Neopestalotiopsis sp. 37M]